MHVRAKPPIFVPEQFRAEIESLSKAAPMDLVWDLCFPSVVTEGGMTNDAEVMDYLRERIEIIQTQRAA